MYQSGNKYKNYENRVINGFVDASIGKHNIKIMKNTIFLTQKAVKITKARSFMEKHENFILYDLCAKSVPCNEAHQNQRIQGEKLSKSRRVMYFWL